MKFDVIIGNPPYQDNRSKTAKLWFEFTKIAVSLKPKYIAFVTPNSWFYEPSGFKIKSTIKALLSGSIIHANTVDVNQYFTVSEDIGYWIWENVKNKEGKFKTNWFGNVSERHFIYNGENIITDVNTMYRSSIEKKLKLKINEVKTSVRLEGIKGMTWPAGVKSVGLNDILSDKKTDKYPYKVLLSPSNTKYTDISDKRLGVCVNVSGYYYVDGQDDKYMPITDDVTGLSFLKIICSNMKEANNVKSFLTSKLYRVYVDKLVDKSFNNYALARLPFLGRITSWTDEAIYKYFGLTQEEIDYIEENVK